MLMKGDFLGAGGVAAMLSGSLVGDACHRKSVRSRMRLQDQARRYLQIHVNRLGEVRARRLEIKALGFSEPNKRYLDPLGPRYHLH
jgi:hypothetical protein